MRSSAEVETESESGQSSCARFNFGIPIQRKGHEIRENGDLVQVVTVAYVVIMHRVREQCADFVEDDIP